MNSLERKVKKAEEYAIAALAKAGSGGGGGGTGAVNSVNGQTGVVNLTQDNIPAGSTNTNFTPAEKTKLSGIANNATANVGTVTPTSTDVFQNKSISGANNILSNIPASAILVTDTEEFDPTNYVSKTTYDILLGRMYAIEEASVYSIPQNLMRWSERLDDDSEWFRSAVTRVVTTEVSPPTGVQTVCLLTAGNGSFTGQLINATLISAEQFANIESGNFSIFLKRKNHDYFAISGGAYNPAGLVSALVNLSNKTITKLAGDIDVKIIILSDDWVRVAINYRGFIPGGPGFTIFAMRFVDANGDESYSTNGTEQVYATGAQSSRKALRLYSKTEGTNIP